LGKRTRGRLFLLGEAGLVPFGAGILSRKEQIKRQKCLFYPLGKEQQPETALQSAVKVITFQGYHAPEDEGQRLLFERDGKALTLMEQKSGDFDDNKAVFYDCVLEINSAGEGSAQGPWRFEVDFIVQHEERKSL